MQHLIFPAFKMIIWIQLTFDKKGTIKIHINTYFREISSYYDIFRSLIFPTIPQRIEGLTPINNERWLT